MATLKEQAVNMVKNVPDDKISYVIDILRSLDSIFNGVKKMPVSASGNSAEAIKAWEELQAYKGIIPYDVDAKAELAKARDEKYADFV